MEFNMDFTQQSRSLMSVNEIHLEQIENSLSEDTNVYQFKFVSPHNLDIVSNHVMFTFRHGAEWLAAMDWKVTRCHD